MVGKKKSFDSSHWAHTVTRSVLVLLFAAMAQWWGWVGERGNVFVISALTTENLIRDTC